MFSFKFYTKHLLNILLMNLWRQIQSQVVTVYTKIWAIFFLFCPFILTAPLEFNRTCKCYLEIPPEIAVWFWLDHSKTFTVLSWFLLPQGWYWCFLQPLYLAFTPKTSVLVPPHQRIFSRGLMVLQLSLAPTPGGLLPCVKEWFLSGHSAIKAR